MKVDDVMTREVRTCSVDDGLHVAAQLMWALGCGCVPVVDEAGRGVGILTDRDVCIAAVTQRGPVEGLRAASAMTTEVLSCRPADTLAAAEEMMRTHRVRLLPFIRLVRELQADRRGQSFLGTNFNYEELALEELEFQEHAVRGEGKVQGRPCYWVESVPDSSCGYGKVARCIDKKDHLPRETQYFDSGDVLFKVRTLDRVEKIGKYITPTVITMRTVPFNTSTRIELSDIKYDADLADSVFEGR